MNIQQHQYVVIMAGGVGSRFWPASTEAQPKQFLDIAGTGKSLLRMTFERFLPLVSAERIIVLTNQQYEHRVADELPELDTGNILLEPSRNNTAPCIAYAAFHIRSRDPQALMVVAPSDHLIEKSSAFLAAIEDGFQFVHDREAILTLGMRPTRPDTGYGYIQYNNNDDLLAGKSILFKVRKFTEKPDKENAKRFLASGDFVWNAGIFLFSVATILTAFEQYATDIYSILEKGEEVYGKEGEKAFLEKYYRQCPDISVDYAIMEKAESIYTLPAQIGWSDLGTWGSVYDRAEKDKQGLLVQHQGAHVLEGNKNSLIRIPKEKKVLIRGLEGFIVVDTDEALLIYPMEEEQNIKSDRGRLKA